jgi:hypothetical protein
MNNLQLYLAIGVPVVVNIGVMLTLVLLIERNIAARFDGMEKLFTEKLLRVEQVMDARIKHLEDK